MSKLIVTSRYLKSGSKKNLSNYVKYIATREGSVQNIYNTGILPATNNQKSLINTLLTDFPNSSNTGEYIEYVNTPTQKNASSYITKVIENNADLIHTRENYVGYIANRPGAVKFGSHGLFSQEDIPINLDFVAKDVANHSGYVWTHVVSLRRDYAQQMGYDNLNTWRELVKRQIPNIAKAQKIDLKNLKWYAAFHDKKNNPHVHIIIYSTDPKEGYLTKDGIEKIRSGFVNDIYADELHHLYAQQTDIRNLLKKESSTIMHSLAAEIISSNKIDQELYELVMRLHDQLINTKGKKVYGYLKKDIKNNVDKVFLKLSENETIQKMYYLWCEMEQQKHDMYSSAKINPPALIDNPQFKSVKNMIIQTVVDIDIPSISDENKYEIISDEGDIETNTNHIKPILNKSYEFKGEQAFCEQTEKITDTSKSINPMLANSIISLFSCLCQAIENDYYNSQQIINSKVDKKLRRAINRKNQELGLKMN